MSDERRPGASRSPGAGVARQGVAQVRRRASCWPGLRRDRVQGEEGGAARAAARASAASRGRGKERERQDGSQTRLGVKQGGHRRDNPKKAAELLDFFNLGVKQGGQGRDNLKRRRFCWIS